MPALHDCSCGEQMLISPRNAGRQISCPRCGTEFRVPESALPHSGSDPQTSANAPTSQEASDVGNRLASTFFTISTSIFILALGATMVLVLRPSDRIAPSDLVSDVNRTPNTAGNSHTSTPPMADGQRDSSEAARRLAEREREMVRQREIDLQRQLERERDEQLRREEQRRQQVEAKQLARIQEEVMKQMTSRAPRILAVAHPFADYEGVQIQDIIPLTGGRYRIVIDIHYSGATDPNGAWIIWTLELEADGKVTSVKCGRDTGVVPPGTVLRAVDELIDEFNRNP